MGFDPCHYSMKIRESIGTPTPKVGIHLRVVHSFTFPYTPKSMKCDSRASFLVRTFVSFCFGREPKARVVTMVNLPLNTKVV
jgi:hypothetical protein